MNDFMVTIETIENWWDLLAVRLGLIDKATLRYRNGLKVPYQKGQMWIYARLANAIRNGIDVRLLENNKVSFRLENTVFSKELTGDGISFLDFAAKLFRTKTKFVDRGTVLLPTNIRLKFPHEDDSALCHIYETFFEEVYALLDVKNRTVLDVGSSFGDTPIYFVLKGATKVYAYEPAKEVFSYLLENIRLNHVDDRVIPRNRAIASKEGNVWLVPARWSGDSYVSQEKNERGYLIEAERLPLDADVLKMDCEGCEYEVLLNMSLGSLGFQEIMLEFHRGSTDLIRILHREGYRTKVVRKIGSKEGMIFAQQR